MLTSALTKDLDALGQIGAVNGGVRRFAWSPELAVANDWLIGKLRGLGLEPHIDAAGNVFGEWAAGSGKAVVFGSHLDTVSQGGHYDGALGVVGGLHAIRLLKQEGFEPRRPLLLACFNDEEGARFGTGLFGSRAFVGDDLSALGERPDENGITLRDAMKAAGFDFDRLAQARGIPRVHAYLELHIEQGPVLGDAGVAIGVVTGIVGVRVFLARMIGEANHAGTTPMDRRRDALCGAAQVTLALREKARQAADLTANVGRIAVEPGGYNVVPGACDFTVDIRAMSSATLDEAEQFVRETLERVAAEEGLEFELRELHRLPPVPTDPRIRKVVQQAAEREGATTMLLASGAGHDAVNLGRYVPVGMLFVPSRNGLSHSPDEYTLPEQCDLGARVLGRAIELLARDDSAL